MKKFMVLAFLALIGGLARADSAEYFFFADSVIGIYADLRDSTVLPPPKANLQGKEFLKFMLKTSVQQGNVYRRAMVRIQDFQKSKDEGIRQAVTLLSSGVLMVQMANADTTNYLEKILNEPKLLMQEGTFARKMAELNDNGEKAWQTYGQTGAIVTFALTEGAKSLQDLKPETMDQKLSKLLITECEIELLKRHLRKSFGPVLADHKKAGWADLPAIGLWGFLNDKWTPAEE